MVVSENTQIISLEQMNFVPCLCRSPLKFGCSEQDYAANCLMHLLCNFDFENIQVAAKLWPVDATLFSLSLSHSRVPAH